MLGDFLGGLFLAIFSLFILATTVVAAVSLVGYVYGISVVHPTFIGFK